MAGTQQGATSHEDFLARMNIYVASDPSPRNPRISTRNSHADRIEAAYQADGHETWGFVVYRTTYESDDDWAELMRRLRTWAADDMDFYNGQDVLDRMTWTIFDDRELFDGADTSTVRRHFRSWAEHAAQSERPTDGTRTGIVRSPRYRYCVQVDAEALEATVHDAPPPPTFDKDRQGWVKVIDKMWLPRSENPLFARRPPAPGMYDYDPIEGTMEYHVGWVNCPAMSVMTEYYMLLQDLNGYMVSYRRPPAVNGYPWN